MQRNQLKKNILEIGIWKRGLYMPIPGPPRVKPPTHRHARHPEEPKAR